MIHHLLGGTDKPCFVLFDLDRTQPAPCRVHSRVTSSSSQCLAADACMLDWLLMRACLAPCPHVQAFAVYKIYSMGLLPTNLSDWVSSMRPPTVLEHAVPNLLQ